MGKGCSRFHRDTFQHIKKYGQDVLRWNEFFLRRDCRHVSLNSLGAVTMSQQDLIDIALTDTWRPSSNFDSNIRQYLLRICLPPEIIRKPRIDTKNVKKIIKTKFFVEAQQHKSLESLLAVSKGFASNFTGNIK